MLKILNGVVAVENRMEVPQKIKKKKKADDPTIALVGIYPKELKAESQRHIYTPVFIAALFTIPRR